MHEEEFILPKPGASVRTLVEKDSTKKSSCSSLCAHPWSKNHSYSICSDSDNSQLNHEPILRTKIIAKKHSIASYRKLKKHLEKENLELRENIDDIDDKTHRYVRQLLGKCEKYSTTFKLLHEKHAEDMKNAANDYQDSKDVPEEDLKRLEEKIALTDEDLKLLVSDLQELRMYNVKEYPVKAMQVAKLKASIENLTVQHQREGASWERFICTGKENARKEFVSTSLAIVDKAGKDAFDKLIPGVTDLISHFNCLYEAEIKKQKWEIKNLESQIMSLKCDVSELTSTSELNFRNHVFPEVFLDTSSCDPDDDVVLDIPKQRISVL